MKFCKYGLFLIVLPLFLLAVSCSNFTAVHTDSSSVTASPESVSSSATPIDQPWLVNEPVTVSVMSDTQPKTIVSDSAVIDHILSLAGNLSYYETSSEDIQGGCPILTLEYPGRRILYTVMNSEYIKIAADGSTKEYRIPKEDGQALYDYLYKYLRDSNAAHPSKGALRLRNVRFAIPNGALRIGIDYFAPRRISLHPQGANQQKRISLAPNGRFAVSVHVT